MVYESEISFTLDTICPWTYLAKRRLEMALEQFRASDAGKDVSFSVKYYPYQLYPDFSQEGEDKHEWYKHRRHDGSEERQSKFEALMSAYGLEAGIPFRWDGPIANTLQAHRVIQHIQEHRGLAAADAAVTDLYGQYFTQARHPSSPDTLAQAARAAGLGDDEARKLAEDGDEGLMEAKMLEREQRGNGIDAVPHIVLEGRKRDFTVEGAKSAEEFLAELNKVAKEAV